MGNLLKQGREFFETLSSTVPWDGIRWCASVACATNKEIYGLDAVTGFLQTNEKFDFYAYTPPHGKHLKLLLRLLWLLGAEVAEL